MSILILRDYLPTPRIGKKAPNGPARLEHIFEGHQHACAG